MTFRSALPAVRITLPERAETALGFSDYYSKESLFVNDDRFFHHFPLDDHPFPRFYDQVRFKTLDAR